jgi:large subunit ribosomal protein L22
LFTLSVNDAEEASCMEASAKARFVRTSPRKARLVIDAIRGKDTREALAILKFTPNFAARLIEKVLSSAIANAENNHHMDADNLKVVKAFVDGGPMMKRLRYAPMGRGYRMVKRLSHITIAVEEGEPRPERKAKRKEVARTAKAPRFGRRPAAAPEAAPAKAKARAEAKSETAAAEAPKKRAPRKSRSEGETAAKGGD